MKSGLLAGKKSKSTFSTSKIENESKINKIDKDNKNRTLRNDMHRSAQVKKIDIIHDVVSIEKKKVASK